MRQHCELAAQKANCILGCINREVREVIVHLCSALVRHCLQYSDQGWEPQHQEDLELLQWVWRKAMKIIRELKHICCVERQRELGLFNLDKRRLQEDFIAAFQYLKGMYKQGGDKRFMIAIRTGRNNLKLK